MEDKEIDLRQMFWRVLLSWRSLIICGILGAVLISGLFMIKDYQNYQKEVLEASEEFNAEDVEASMTESEYKDALALAYVYNEKSELEHAMQNSYIMQLNLRDTRYSTLNYYIMESENIITIDDETDDQDTMLIEQGRTPLLYANNFLNEAFMNEFEQCFDTDLSYDDISNLINITVQGSNLSIYYLHSKDIDSTLVNALIRERMDELNAEYQTYVEHELVLLSEFDVECPYAVLNDKKTAYSGAIYALQSQIWTLESRLSSAQITYAEHMALYSDFIAEAEDVEADASELNGSSGFVPQLHKKYILLGCVVGVLLMCAWIVVKEVLSAKLSSAEELTDVYTLPVIGKLEQPAEKKRLLHGIDDGIIALKERNHKKLSYEQQLENIVTAIGVRCQQEGIKRFCLTGTSLMDVKKDMLDDIEQQLQKHYDIEAVLKDNITYNAESLKACSEVGNVVIMEVVGVSIEEEIKRQLTTLKEYNVNILGAIAV